MSEKTAEKLAEARANAAAFLWTPLGVVLGSTLVFGLVCAEGFVLSRIWAWHLVALGLPAVTWGQMAAVRLMYALARNSANGRKDDRSGVEQAKHVAVYLCWPWLALGIAWVLK